jgi:hypothetical protein
MSIQRRVSWISQARVDVPDMRAIESAVSADFDASFEAFVTGSGNPYIINGFALNMASSPIGNAASNLQIIVANGALMHTTASQSGTIYLVPSGTPNVTLNAATVPNVSGAFVPGTNNYVGIDYYRFQDPTTDVQRYLWNPSTNQEDQTIEPAAIILNYEFVITPTLWASNILPIAVILTDSGNNVVSITDSRPLLFRLGTGGASPNPFYVYPWPEGTTESSPTTFSNGSNPFYGGDKGITDLKDWIDAVETLLLDLGGGPYWYSPIGSGPTGSIAQLREDTANTILTGNGNITHSATTAGLINWSSPMNLTIIGSNLNYQITTNPTGTTITLSDGQVAYLNLQRDLSVAPNLIWTNGSATVSSVGSIPWTTGLYSVTTNGAGDWIKLTSDTHAGYYQIQTINSSSQVTLVSNFTEASTGSSGASSQYAYGLYTLPGVTGTLRDIQIALRSAVPISPSTFWLFSRKDNAGSIPRVYVRWLGLDLQQGDSEEISGPQLQNVLTYIGSPIESSTTPLYVSAYNVYEGNSPTVVSQIISITTGAASTTASDEYAYLFSSGNYREYYIWVKKDGFGTDPMPIAGAIGLEWDVTTGQTSTQTAASLVTLLNGTFFKDFTASNIGNVITVTNNSAGVTDSPANVSIGAPFAMSVTQSGTGFGNFAINDGDSLTLAIKKLDFEMGVIAASLDAASYDEVIEIVASGATPPTSLNGPISPGTNIFLPNNTREAGAVQYYTVGRGSLMIFLNGQFLDLESGAYTEVGASESPSNQFQIHIQLVVGDELEIRLSGGGGGAGGGGSEGPPGPPGPTGPAGPAGTNAFGNPVTVSTKTSNYTLMTTDFVILGDCTSGGFTLSLPTVSAGVGRIFFLKKIDSTSNVLTVQGNGSDLIDGSNTFLLTSQWQDVTVVSSGSAWYIL